MLMEKDRKISRKEEEVNELNEELNEQAQSYKFKIEHLQKEYKCKKLFH